MTNWPPRWTWSAPSAAPPSACARRASCGSGCRWPGSPSRHPDAAALAPYAELICDEVNVKEVVLSTDPASLGTFELAVNPRVLGPRIGAKVQEVIRAVKAGNWARTGTRSPPRESSFRPANTKSGWPPPSGVDLCPAGQRRPGRAGHTVTPELAAEGTARDVVRIVQQARRDAGLAVSDRIKLTIGADGAVADAVRAHAGSWPARRSRSTWRCCRPPMSTRPPGGRRRRLGQGGGEVPRRRVDTRRRVKQPTAHGAA